MTAAQRVRCIRSTGALLASRSSWGEQDREHKIAVPAEAMVPKLGWAAQLHEIGNAISHEESHKQLASLRLAVILCHTRRDPQLEGLQLHARQRQISMAVPRQWARQFPQWAHLLREEALAWQKTPWTLAIE